MLYFKCLYITIFKCQPPDTRYAVAYRHDCKSPTFLERSLPNARHAVRNRQTRQPTAIFKRFIPDGRHAVRNRQARKTAAAVERRRLDARNAAAYCHARQPAAIPERRIPDARHAVRHSNNFFQRIFVLACRFLPSRIARRCIGLDVFNNNIESPNCRIGMNFLTDVSINLLNSPVSPVNDNRLACVIPCSRVNA